MSRLIIDIETIGEHFSDFDDITKADLTKSITASKGTKEYREAVKEIDRNLVFSPLTGEIVVIGVLDADKDRGVVYFQAPDSDVKEFTEDEIDYKPMDEKQMLESFWGGAARYTEFITWNGRMFDIPYLTVRSAVHGVSITKDLMSHRYLGSQRAGARHIDLFDQVSHYNAVRRPGSLHMWCRALGIPSPKEGDVAAGDVSEAFDDGRYEEIARYNSKDLFATKALYDVWRQYMQTL